MINKMYIAKACQDIGTVSLAIKDGKSLSDIRMSFIDKYDKRVSNPQWNDNPPDKVFDEILRIIEEANKNKK